MTAAAYALLWLCAVIACGSAVLARRVRRSAARLRVELETVELLVHDEGQEADPLIRITPYQLYLIGKYGGGDPTRVWGNPLVITIRRRAS